VSSASNRFGYYTSLVILCTGFGVAVLTARLIIDARVNYYKGTELLKSGNRVLALNAFEDSVRAYIPGNIYCEQSLQKMAVIARVKTMNGDIQGSLDVWEVVRRSILSVRHSSQPFLIYLQEAESQIEILSKEQQGVGDKVLKEMLVRPDDPSATAVVLMITGLLLWVSGAIAAIFSSVGSRRYVSLFMSMSGLFLWIVMVYLA